MRPSSIILTVTALAASACALPTEPYTRMTLVKRQDMHCSNHNWGIMCAITHHCVNGVVADRPGHHAVQNPECTHECNCGRPAAPPSHGGGRPPFTDITNRVKAHGRH
ncbi:hypothetical protein B0H34DRAFT_803217 [Crassisporium funariophilum]|nr:hypothetical protein B0H34DRAFT_803217 [Crassisporium funariophilum]